MKDNMVANYRVDRSPLVTFSVGLVGEATVLDEVLATSVAVWRFIQCETMCLGSSNFSARWERYQVARQSRWWISIVVWTISSCTVIRSLRFFGVSVRSVVTTLIAQE